MALTFASVNSNSVAYYVPLTITNSQSVASPSPFQQMVTVNSSNYSKYLASNLQNINFQDGSGNILNSWLESGNSSSSTSTVYWIKLPNGIPANSSITIYYCIYATSVNAFNTTNTGIAPNLTSTYGQYDDGTSVFNNYWNFAGTTAPSGWTLQTGWSVNNGLITASGTGTTYYAYYSTNSTPPIIEDFYSNLPVNTGSWNQLFGFVTTSTRLGWLSYSGTAGGANGQWGMYAQASATAPGTFNFTNTYYGTGIYSIYYTSTSSASLSFNYGSLVDTVTTNIVSSIPSGGYQINGAPYTIQWLRTRAYPPSGVMPSITFGSVGTVQTDGVYNYNVVLIS